jgi:YegS/Rv2252/BmrU family lipid kinase
MEKRRLLLIINPCAGKKKVTKQLADIIAIFNKANYEVITYITAAGGDCENIAFSYAEQVDLIVCSGGDGTFNEMISGVIKSGVDVPVGYIPAGSTNDFATSLQIPTDMLEAAKEIVEGEAFRFDIGQFCDRYFVYIASFGVFTKTSYETPQELKNVLGHAAYVLSGIQEVAQLKPRKLSI